MECFEVTVIKEIRELKREIIQNTKQLEKTNCNIEKLLKKLEEKNSN